MLRVERGEGAFDELRPERLRKHGREFSIGFKNMTTIFMSLSAVPVLFLALCLEIGEQRKKGDQGISDRAILRQKTAGTGAQLLILE
jgi:hypothetical protein